MCKNIININNNNLHKNHKVILTRIKYNELRNILKSIKLARYDGTHT